MLSKVKFLSVKDFPQALVRLRDSDLVKVLLRLCICFSSQSACQPGFHFISMWASKEYHHRGSEQPADDLTWQKRSAGCQQSVSPINSLSSLLSFAFKANHKSRAGSVRGQGCLGPLLLVGQADFSSGCAQKGWSFFNPFRKDVLARVPAQHGVSTGGPGSMGCDKGRQEMVFGLPRAAGTRRLLPWHS